MDKLKKDILNLLKEDARYEAEKLAVMLGASNGEVKNAILDLENEGVIVKYSALVNENKLGEELVEAMIEVRVSPQHAKGFDAIAEEIYVFPEVKSVYLMSGAYDLVVIIEGKTLREVAMFVSEKLSTMREVNGTATHFILKKYKVNGVLLEDGGDGGRLSVQP